MRFRLQMQSLIPPAAGYLPLLLGQLEQPAKAILAGRRRARRRLAREGFGQGDQRLRDRGLGRISISGTPLLRASIIVR